MTTPCPWARRALPAVCLLLCFSLLTLAASAAAAPSRQQRSTAHVGSNPVAVAARILPRPVMIASRRARAADRVLVADALRLKRCLAAHRVHPRRCDGARHALQLAGARLAVAERRLSRVGRAGKSHGAKSATLADLRVAPVLTVSGQTLVWNKIGTVNTYVLVRKVPGMADQYSVVTGTSITPPPVPGMTVRYSVRTTTWWSAWATERSITYPPAGQPVPAPDKQAAPAITVSGMTISWNAVAGLSTYVFVRKVPGQVDQYSEISGTSVTPAAVPGVTVKYSVRTAIQGSAWAPEVSIAYPRVGSPPPVPPPPPPVEPPPTEGPPPSLGMMVGIDAGGWNWESAVNGFAGAVKVVRASYSYYGDDTHMGYLAKNGVKLLPLFSEGGTIGSINRSAFAGKIVTWFKRYGHGGTFWAGKTDLGATTAEILNEPGNPYFWSDPGNVSGYAALATTVYEALEANLAAANRPGLLLSYDGGFEGDNYGRSLVRADPSITKIVGAWTVHPYGGKTSLTQSALGHRERVTEAHADTGLPVDVTEIGWPTAVGLPATGDSLQWSETQQAENITNFVKWSRGLGYVNAVVYFNYADYGTNNFYGIVHSSGTGRKLSYEALKTAAGTP
jgi:hypothetical protein